MKRMTWNEIQSCFPNQCVGLIDVETGINDISIKSAIVRYSDTENDYGVEVVSPSQLLRMARNREVVREYTSTDDYDFTELMTGEVL